MTDVLYRMVGFDKEKRFPGQDDWCDYVYAGENGCILVLLGRDYVPRKPRASQNGETEDFWEGAKKGKAGDWFQFRQTKDESNNRWYTQVRSRERIYKKYVHHLILWAWRGPTKCGQEIPADKGRHLNSISSDNRRQNLEWGSVEQDRADRETPKNRERVKVGRELLDGVKFVLASKSGSWEIQAFRDGLPLNLHELPKIQSKRQTSAMSLLQGAIDAIQRDAKFPTIEKWPHHYDGHIPWHVDHNLWIPNDFGLPNELDEDFTKEHGANRCKTVTIGRTTGIVYEFVSKAH